MSNNINLTNFKGETVKEVELPFDAHVIRFDDRYYIVSEDGTAKESGFFWADAVLFTPYWLFLPGQSEGGMTDFHAAFATFDEAEIKGHNLKRNFQIIDMRNPHRYYFMNQETSDHGWSDGRA